jgi:Icc-related predicted phosphoesterase
MKFQTIIAAASTALLTTAFIVMAGAGCLEVADDRAELDSRIGKAETGGDGATAASVEIEDGLALVREFEPGRLVLWAQAPQLSIQLEPGGAAGWEIRVKNALADAQLRLIGPDSAPRVIEAAPDLSDTLTERVWLIEGLEPDAAYTLEVFAPDADDISPWHFATFADVQDHLFEVEDIYARMALDEDLRFCLISGDLTEGGTPEQLAEFERKLKKLPIPCYATLGNHDLGYSDTAFRERFGRGNFSFEFRGTRFTLLDSASATLAPLVYDWLGDWLDAGEGDPHAVLMHIPPLDPSGQRNGAFASRAEANKLTDMLADHDVDLAIYGHLHSYYAFSHVGITAFITGGGGAIPQRLDGIGRHYLKITVDPVDETFSSRVVRVDP